MTEKRIEKVTIGGAKKLNGKILLADYDENWKSRYEEEEKKIQAALGEKIVTLEHVGSTSVPGLMAKPIIDIVLEVENSANEESYIPNLEKKGYRLKIREGDWFEHRLLKDSKGSVNLHVFSKGCSETKKMISFKNHLIENKEDFELYQNTKKDLASKDWEYTQDYADAKSSVVKDIFSRIK